MSGLFLFYFILRTGFHLKFGATGCQIANRQHRSARAESKIEGVGLPGRSLERLWLENWFASAFTTFRRDSLHSLPGKGWLAEP